MVKVFLFRRDLRLYDNTGLINALKNEDEIAPIFIFTPKQIENNEYKGDNSFEFLLNSLRDLNNKLKEKGSRLYCFYGDPIEIVKSISCNKIYLNYDYTPFSIKRDEGLKKNFEVIGTHDILLNEPNKVLKEDKKPYTIFTPYYRKTQNFKIEEPIENYYTNYFKGKFENEISIEEIENKFLRENNKNLLVKGGRDEGLKLLQNFSDKITSYVEKRDYPQIDATSKLSAHNKFGTLSPREIYYYLITLPNCEGFIRQLYWRDFFTQIAYHFPKVFGNNFNSKYDSVSWDTDPYLFDKWCKGITGFPIVDAGMRELNETGYMHNRVRMIVASFLTKDLHIDWRMGEKYFAQKLVDYDPCVNNGSWQWAASTGCDAQPYFRIFNPFRQQIRFDPNCEYIKKWIPELKDVSAKEIHSWGNLEDKKGKSSQSTLKNWNGEENSTNYPKPIVDHFKEKEETLRRFKS